MCGSVCLLCVTMKETTVTGFKGLKSNSVSSLPVLNPVVVLVGEITLFIRIERSY